MMRSLVLFAFAASAAFSADINPDEIIRKFAAKESEFLKAREAYTYRQTVKLEELDNDGNPHGKYEMVSDIIFSGDKKRSEKVVRSPPNSLQNVILTPQDEQDLRNVQPFVLNSDEISKYNIKYLGKENADEIPCYKFNVQPKQLLKNERYFQGDIWVDDRDLQIVKTFGQGVGQEKRNSNNRYPKFETYRQQIDGKYWFPTYTHADDVLDFKDNPQRIRMTVKYQNYKRFGAETTITFGDEVKEQTKPITPPK